MSRVAWQCGLGLVGVLCLADPAHAYLRGARFGDPPSEGGGGGRYFTGSPGDGYTCAVCHDGGPEVGPPELLGAPVGEYSSGESYDLELRLPAGAGDTSAVLEVTDAEGNGAGTLEVLGAEDLTPCIGAEEPPVRLASLPQGRTVAFADACDVPAIRVRWTPPVGGLSPLWLTGVVVVGDGAVDLQGDAVYTLRQRLRLDEDSAPVALSGSSCSTVPSPSSAVPLLLLGLVILRRGSRRRPAV